MDRMETTIKDGNKAMEKRMTDNANDDNKEWK